MTPEQMQRNTWADARDGIFFLCIDSAGELSCEARVYWEVPGAILEYELVSSRTTLTLAAVERVVAWSGPTPGLVCLELRFDNAGLPTKAHLLADLVAKRLGCNFMPGHFFRDRTGSLRAPVEVRRFDPDPEGRRAPKRKPPGRKCIKVALPSLASPMPPRNRSASGAYRRRTAERRSGRASGDPYTPSIRYEPTCTPAASAIDWFVGGGADGSWSYVDSEGSTVFVVPDPEVMAAWRALGEYFILAEPRSGGAVLFPLRFDLFDRSDRERLDPWYQWIGRCAGFDELWEEVSQGLEKSRLPQYKLGQMLLDDVTNAYARDKDGETVSVGDFVQDVADATSTAWQWSVPAPWISDPQAWGIMSLINLINGTLSLLPAAIRSPRANASTTVLDSARLVERFTRSGDPNLRLAIVDFDRFMAVAAPFSLADATWPITGQWQAELAKNIDFKGETNGLAARDPMPASIAVNGALTVPYFEASAKCYTVARLLTMVAAKYKTRLLTRTWELGDEPVGDAFTVLVEYAKVWFRMHLGGLMHPGKTLVHEMFHTTVWHGPEQWSLLEFEEQIADTDHCGSGCGQEKMGSSWLMRVCGEHGAWYPEWDDATGEPFRLLATQTRSSNSQCVGAGEASSFDDGTVFLDWTITNLGKPDAELTWSFDASLSASTQATIARVEKDWDNAAGGLNARISAIEAELSSLATTRVTDFWRYLSIPGPLVESGLWLELGWDVAAVGVVNDWYAALIGDLQRGQRDRFEQMCWSPTSRSDTCGRFGSCG